MPRTYGQMMQQVRAKEAAAGADTLTDADFNAPALEDSSATPAFSEEPYTEEPFVEEVVSSPTSLSKVKGARIGEIAPMVPEDIITPEMGGGIAGASYGARFSPAAAALGARVAGSVGAAVGGTIPPVLGAAFGGAGVESFRQIYSALEGKEITPEEAQKALGGAAIRQGTAELGGRTLVGGAKLVGNAAMAWALRTNPELAQAAIKLGVNATKAGAARAQAIWKAVTRAERRLATTATRTGVRIAGGSELGDLAFADVQKQLKGATIDDIEKLKKLHKDFTRGRFVGPRPKPVVVSPSGRTETAARKIVRPPGLTPDGKYTANGVLYIRKYADKKATGLWQKRDFGKIGNPSVAEMWWEAIGNRSRDALRTKVPGIANPETYRRMTGTATVPSEIVPLKQVVDKVVKRSPSLGRRILERGAPTGLGAAAGAAYGATHGGDVGRSALVGGAVGGGLGLASSPQFLSLAAQIATNPVLLQALSQLPRLAVSVTQQEEAQ